MLQGSPTGCTNCPHAKGPAACEKRLRGPEIQMRLSYSCIGLWAVPLSIELLVRCAGFMGAASRHSIGRSPEQRRALALCDSIVSWIVAREMNNLT